MSLPRRLVAAATATSAVAVFSVLGPAQQSFATPAATSPGDSSSSSSVAGAFYPVPVQRLVGSTGGVGTVLTGGGTTTVDLQGRDGLPPSGISAVVVNVVVTAGASATTVSLSSVDAQPGAAGQRFQVAARTTRAFLLTVPLATAGAFQLHSSGAATALVDLEGFYAADDTVVASVGVSGGYQPVDPQRLYDTRQSSPVAASDRRLLSVDLGTATSDATALLLRVTTGGSTAAGALTVQPSSTTQAWPSVTYPKGAPGTNLAVVPAELDSDGHLDVALQNDGTAPVDVTVDLIGFYDDGQLGPNLRFRPLTPASTSDATPGTTSWSVPARGSVTIQPGPEVVGDSTFGLVGLLTVAPAAAGKAADLALTDADDTTAADAVATQIATSADAATTSVQPEVAADGSMVLRSVSGTSSVLLDVVGTLESSPPVAPGAPRSWVAPIAGWEVSASAR